MGGIDTENEDTYATAAANLWLSMVHRPWLTLEFLKYGSGENLNGIVEQILSTEPDSDARKQIIEDNKAQFPKSTGLKRFSMTVIYFVLSFFKSLLFLAASLMLLAMQAYCIFLLLLLPFILLLLLVPGYGSRVIGTWFRQLLEKQLGIIVLFLALGFLLKINEVFAAKVNEYGWAACMVFELFICGYIIFKYQDVLNLMDVAVKSAANPAKATHHLTNWGNNTNFKKTDANTRDAAQKTTQIMQKVAASGYDTAYKGYSSLNNLAYRAENAVANGVASIPSYYKDYQEMRERENRPISPPREDAISPQPAANTEAPRSVGMAAASAEELRQAGWAAASDDEQKQTGWTTAASCPVLPEREDKTPETSPVKASDVEPAAWATVERSNRADSVKLGAATRKLYAWTDNSAEGIRPAVVTANSERAVQGAGEYNAPIRTGTGETMRKVAASTVEDRSEPERPNSPSRIVKDSPTTETMPSMAAADHTADSETEAVHTLNSPAREDTGHQAVGMETGIETSTERQAPQSAVQPAGSDATYETVVITGQAPVREAGAPWASVARSETGAVQSDNKKTKSTSSGFQPARRARQPAAPSRNISVSASDTARTYLSTGKPVSETRENILDATPTAHTPVGADGVRTEPTSNVIPLRPQQHVSTSSTPVEAPKSTAKDNNAAASPTASQTRNRSHSAPRKPSKPAQPPLEPQTFSKGGVQVERPTSVEKPMTTAKKQDGQK